MADFHTDIFETNIKFVSSTCFSRDEFSRVFFRMSIISPNHRSYHARVLQRLSRSTIERKIDEIKWNQINQMHLSERLRYVMVFVMKLSVSPISSENYRLALQANPIKLSHEQYSIG